MENRCQAAVEMKEGVLDFNLSNSTASPKTGQQDACVLVRELAAKVAALLPPGS
jgi:hypothetical protein